MFTLWDAFAPKDRNLYNKYYITFKDLIWKIVVYSKRKQTPNQWMNELCNAPCKKYTTHNNIITFKTEQDMNKPGLD